MQRLWHFFYKIVCRDITEDLKAVLILLFCRWKVFMQIRRSPEQRNIFWSGLGKQLKKLRGKILWLQTSSTLLLVSYLIYWIYAFIVWREFSCRKMKKRRLTLMINLCQVEWGCERLWFQLEEWPGIFIYNLCFQVSYKFRIKYIGFCETAHLPLPYTKINTYFSFWAKC